MAERCLKKAKDLSGLLLLHTARGSEQGLTALASDAQESGKQNVSFLSRFLLGKVDECIDVLLASGRTPEAAFFARTYKPSRISEVNYSLRCCLFGSQDSACIASINSAFCL